MRLSCYLIAGEFIIVPTYVVRKRGLRIVRFLVDKRSRICIKHEFGIFGFGVVVAYM